MNDALAEARQYLAQRAWPEAERALAQALDDWQADYWKAVLAWSRGQFDDAQGYFAASLEKNPGEPRVAFERNLLAVTQTGAQSLAPLPGVHDTLACAAVVLFNNVQPDEAAVLLDGLDQPEAAYDPALVLAPTRAARIKQGWALRAHLAEARGDWANALAWWDTARGSSTRDPAINAHRAYLLSRLSAAAPEDRGLDMEAQRQWNRLAQQPLTGLAAFYWGVAAERIDPRRVPNAWRKALETIGSVPPGGQYWLALADRLRAANLTEDARRAYDMVKQTARGWLGSLTTNAPGRLRFLIDAPPPDIAPRLKAILACLRALAVSDRKPEAAQAALSALDSDDSWRAVLENLIKWCARLQDLDASTLPESGPPRLRTALDLLRAPANWEHIRAFADAYGDEWTIWCPLDPEAAIRSAIADAVKDRLADLGAAFGLLDEVDRLGLNAAVDTHLWRAWLLLYTALNAAHEGDFDKADRLVDQALTLL